MNKKIVIIISIVIILSGAKIYNDQMELKRISIENADRINQAELELKQKQYQDEQDRIAEEEATANYHKFMLNACLDRADNTYWSYVKLNGTEKEDGTVWALNSVWDTAKEDKKNAENACYRKYQ